ncbi:MAG TPA: hypothetical protein VGX28_04505 [Frankiaceae bacterium]|nr:hypothetical protein [Frankiaceae bacterium]
MIGRRWLVVVALVATTTGCDSGPFGGGCKEARLVVDPVDVVRGGAKVPDVRLRARLTDKDGRPLRGAEIQFTLTKEPGQGQPSLEYTRGDTGADGVVEIPYGSDIVNGIEQHALDARHVNARLTTVLGDWQGYCEATATAPFRYRR